MNQDAEPIDPIKKQMIRAGALHLDDLTFNQAGELSPRQKRWLLVNLSFWAILTGCNLTVILFIAYFFYQQNNLLLFCAASLFWSFMLGLSTLTCIAHVIDTWNDIRKNEIRTITGIVSKHFSFVRPSKTEAGGGYCSLQIRGHKFTIINPIVYASIVDDRSYRLFYTPETKKIINIEPLFHLNTHKQFTQESEEKPT